MDWYYNHKGKLQGPLSTAQIQALIDAKSLGPDDLVFAAGAKKWTPLSELQEFASKFDQKDRAQDLRNAAWVVLRRDPLSKKVVQHGPFLTPDIRAKVKAGEFKLSDYIWRSGMKEWYRIGTFPELVDTANESEAKTQESELLSNVVELRTSVEKDTEIIPEEARPTPPPMEAVSTKSQPSILLGKSKLTKSGSFKQIDWSKPLVAGIFVIGLATLLLGRFPVHKQFVGKMKATWTNQWTAFSKPSETSKPSPPNDKVVAEVAEKPLPTVAKVAEKPPEKPVKPTPTPETKRAATFLKLVNKSKEAELVIQTDASSHFSAELVFTSVEGEVIGAKSYHRILKMKNRALDLAELRWPVGQYRVEGALGDFKDKATVFVGSAKDYKSRLNAYKKSLSMDFMYEKLALIQDTSDIMQLASQLSDLLNAPGKQSLSAWDKKYKASGSKTLRNIGPRSRNGFIFADRWMQLKEDWKALKRLRSTLGKGKPDPVGTAELADIRVSLKSQAQEAQLVSFWR